MTFVRFVNAILIAISAACGLASAQTPAAAAEPGLKLAFESIDGKQSDSRISRLIALCVPEGANPTPFLAPGPFRATWTGFINLKLRGEYTFSFAGSGEVELTINGEPAPLGAKPIKLKKGANAIVVKYVSPVKRDAILRLSWAEKNSPAEPVPPGLLTHDADESLAKAMSLRQGRELFITMRCLKCHASNEFAAREGAMPELAIDAPNLDDAGSRLKAKWIAQWINDPRMFRADASMPRIFHESKPSDAIDPRAIDIAKFLASRGADEPKTTLAIDDASIAAGARLFTRLGCVACHVAPNRKSAEDETRVPLCNVKQKFKSAALLDFLRQPERHYTWIRMPNFALSEEEAKNFATFLLGRAPDDASPEIDFTKADGKHGEELFNSSGCVNCHAPNQKSPFQAPDLASLRKSDWKSGCLAEANQTGKAPQFGFTDQQRESIALFAKSAFDSLARDAAPEFAERQVASLNCTACHVRDAQQDRWSSLDPEIQTLEANLPPAPAENGRSEIGGDQSRPVLTWAGDKLKPDWMASFIAGKIAYKPRPWLAARMPAFPARAKGLAEGFSFEHGWPLRIPDEPPPDPDLVHIGRRLLGRVNGFSCNQCHAVGTTPALVPFDSPAPNFSHTHDRMRKDYYHRWVRTPMKYQPGTRMPQYADMEGKTAYKDVLGGDAEKQFEAIWQYLRAGEKIVPPE